MKAEGQKLKIIFYFIIILIGKSFCDVPVYITFLWHMHQPIYTPADPAGDDAYSTILRNGTSDGRTFSYSLADMWASKGGPYRGWATDAIEQGLDLPHLGAQIDLTGSLMESLNNLDDNNWNGDFYGNWKSRFYTVMNYKTSLNNPRLDVISFPYHHPLLGLLWENDIVVQFLCNIKYLKINFPGYNSKGVFPPETAIATWNIKALKQVGMEWVMVDNIHLFRTLIDYPWTSASGVVEPNKADQINGTASSRNSSWVQLNGLWAPNKVCMPWGYQPHYAQYIDPETGTSYKIMIIPAACYEGNEDARGGFGALNYPAVFAQYLPYNTNPNHPMIALLHHDGENYGAGSESYYHSNFGNYCQWLRNNPSTYIGTTIQDYLDTFPPDPNDIVHFESGGWIGSGCLSPEFQYWLGDPNPYPTGYSPDWNSWAVITAARNWMMTAYAKVNGAGSDYFNLTINDPIISDIIYNTGSYLAKAFHYYIRSQASCYEYWEGGPDENIWNANPTRSCNRAIDIIKNNIGVTTNDDYLIGPSIFLPQRQPYNPGGTEWGVQQPSDFEVWTFIYDLNGISQTYVKYRIDDDVRIDNKNYTYTGTVGTIYSQAMNSSELPPVQRPSTPVPYYRAKRYYATISGINNRYVDYWVEAIDAKGNKSKSPIMHVWVGQGGGGGQTKWKPQNPTQNDIITVYGAKSGWLHWGVNNWHEPITNYWPSGTFRFGDGKAVESPLQGTTSWTINIGPFNNPNQQVTVVDFVFHYSDGSWDNNNGQDYHIPITIVTGNSPPTAPQGFQIKKGCSKLKLSWNLNAVSDIWKYKIYRKSGGGNFSFLKSVSHPTNIYYDNSVTNDITYYYYITAVDTATQESQPSITLFETPKKYPDKPQGLTGIEINKKAKLSWSFNLEFDIKQYNIYRTTNLGAGWSYTSSVGFATNQFIDSNVTNWKTYYYVITAVNVSNYESIYSSYVSVYIPGGAPSPPKNILASSETNKVYLRWDRNTEPNFYYYEVYRTNIQGFTNYIAPIAYLTNATNNKYIDYNVINGETYYYRLKAVNSNFQKSSFSVEVKIKVDAKPSPPANIQTTAGNHYISINWSPNIETNIKGYNIYRSYVYTNPSNFIKLNSNLITNGTSYNDYNLTNGKRYYYTLTAVNKLLLESDFSIIVSNTPYSNQGTAPNPVENFTIYNIPQGNALKLSWQNPSLNYYQTLIIRNIEGYNNYPTGNLENGRDYNIGEIFGENGIIIYKGNRNNFTNTNLINGNTYYYIAYTCNSNFIYSQPRFTSKICSDTQPPEKPQNLKFQTGDKFIKLYWNRVIDPKNRISYIIYKKIIGIDVNFKTLAITTNTNYIDHNVDYNNTYQYYIISIDEYYNSSNPSEFITILFQEKIIPAKEEVEIRNNVLSLRSEEKNKTYIYLKIDKKSKVKIKLYDLTGKLVKEIADEIVEPYNESSIYFKEWDGKDYQNEYVGSGVYLCVIEIENKRIIKRVIVIK